MSERLDRSRWAIFGGKDLWLIVVELWQRLVQNLGLNCAISYQRLKICSKTKSCGLFAHAVIDASQGAKARADSKSCGFKHAVQIHGHRVCGFSLCGRSLRRHRSKRGHNLDSSDEELVPSAPDATPLHSRKNRENQRKRPIYLPYLLHEQKTHVRAAKLHRVASWHQAQLQIAT